MKEELEKLREEVAALRRENALLRGQQWVAGPNLPLHPAFYPPLEPDPRRRWGGTPVYPPSSSSARFTAMGDWVLG